MIRYRLHRLRRDDDRGFALIFTLLVTTMVMAAVATSLAITTPNIVSSKTSQDTAAALLAAESGIQDAIAYLTNTPACRSETRICPQALGANSTTLKRPNTLGTSQSFTWSTAPSTTVDGFVRVTSVGTEAGTSKTLVADLALNPSILKYGYYSDYESQSPSFFNGYYVARKIDITNSTTYSNVTSVSSTTLNNYPVPQTATWVGASASANNSDSVCGEHWYYDSPSSPGRYKDGTTWTEGGTLDRQNTSRTGTCDLVFTTGMNENGMTYSRDALLISDAGGSGPLFEQPVYSLWGFGSHNTPAPSGGIYYRQNEAGATPNSNGYSPTLPASDITLPTTVGTDGIETNSCVYFGPTRVVLNGDGTATVTSPDTTSANPGSDKACYPSGSFTSGITNFTLNYATTGYGTIYVKNQGSLPSGKSWPESSLTSQTAPSASNEVFWIPTTNSASPDASTSAAPSSACASGNTYSANANATCAWTNLPNGTNLSSGSGLGWSAYSSTAKCNASLNANDRQLFECEYSNTTGAATPPADQYAAVRTLVQNYLAGGTCATGTIASQQSCITSGMDTSVLTAADTSKTYNATNPASGAHQYYATSTTGTVATGSKTLPATNPMASDSLFSWQGTNGSETSTSTPITVTVYRQTYSGGKWGAGTPQFTFTITHTDWSLTKQPSGVDYFPSTQDVTLYNTGATVSGSTVTAAGSSGAVQPGDLYVQGQTGGNTQLSLVAQDDVEITGNITKNGLSDTSTTDPISITAGADVRNYHPVSCVDQTAADINATTAGFCPNDIDGLTTNSYVSGSGFASWAPPAQYTNIQTAADRTIDAAVFALSGSLRTDNYNRATAVGNLTINGGVYQSHRGANGTQNSSGDGKTVVRTGTYLQYNWVDLQRGGLQYVPSASYSTNPRVWNVVSTSDGS